MSPTGACFGLLLAQGFFQDFQVLLAGFALGGALLVGACIIALVKRWRKNIDSDTPSPSEQLTQYRSLYEQGLISKEEFDRLRSVLGEMMHPPLERSPRIPPASLDKVTPEPGRRPPDKGDTPPSGSSPTGIQPG